MQAQLLILAQGQQHRRKYAAGARRRGRHDAPHTGVGLRHAQRLGNDLADIAAGHGLATDAVLPHLHAVAAHQTADGALLPRVAVRRVHHGLPCGQHFGHGLVAGHLPGLHVVL